MVLRVVLDANVLFPTSLRNVLLKADIDGLCEVFWTEAILDEFARNAVNKGGKSALATQTLIESLKAAFAEATITGHEGLIPQMANDPKDRHVAAAACHAGIPLIATFNLKDFKNLQEGTEAVSPDTLLCALLDRHPRSMARIITEQADRLKRPPMTAPELLAKLARTVPAFAARMGEELERDQP